MIYIAFEQAGVFDKALHCYCFSRRWNRLLNTQRFGIARVQAHE